MQYKVEAEVEGQIKAYLELRCEIWEYYLKSYLYREGIETKEMYTQLYFVYA